MSKKRPIENIRVFSVYSKEMIPRDFGFGLNPFDDPEAAAPIFERFGIVIYRHSIENQMLVVEPGFQGPCFWSMAHMDDDFCVESWRNVAISSKKVERIIKENGDDLMWVALNDPLRIVEITPRGPRKQR